MARLQEITASLSASNSPDEIARAVVSHALEELSASAALMLRADPDAGDDLRLAHAVGFPPERVDPWRVYPATLPAHGRNQDGGKVAPGVYLVRVRTDTAAPITRRLFWLGR